MEYWLKFLGVILAVCIADICWTYYFLKVEERKAFAAALWSMAIMACGAFSVNTYVDDKSFVFAALIGAFLGTYASVWYKKKKEERDKK